MDTLMADWEDNPSYLDTPEQLEAEHDLTVDAMESFGMHHRMPLSLDDIL